MAAGERVSKRGRTTCITRGVVEEVNYNEISPVDQSITMDHQILITPIDPATDQPVQPVKGIYSPPFVDDGDSGSIILNQAHEIVGLLWGVRMPVLPDPNDPNIRKSTPNGQGLANHIELVTDALHVAVSFAPPGSGGTTAATLERPAPRAEPEPLVTSAQLFRKIAAELDESANGRHLLGLVRRFDGEVIERINHDRPVLVAWRRNQGPAFVAAFINHGLGKIDRMPRELGGARLHDLMRIMGDQLSRRGSKELAQAIAEHREVVLGYVDRFETLEGFLQEMRGTSVPADLLLPNS